MFNPEFEYAPKGVITYFEEKRIVYSHVLNNSCGGIIVLMGKKSKN